MLKVYCMKETVHSLRRPPQCQHPSVRKKERTGERKGVGDVKREKDNFRTY